MRHGEAAYVSPEGVVTTDPRNVPLTPEGRAQAKTQGKVLADIQFDRVICSGLPRTAETAQMVLAQSQYKTQPEVEVVPELEEIHGMKGDRKWPPDNGQSIAEVLADIANPWAHGARPEATFLGGEAFADFDQRVSTQWDKFISAQDWEVALLVLHGGVNRMIFNHMIGLDWRGDLCIEQDNCCINIIDVDDTTPRRYLIRGVNITAYNLSKDGITLTKMEATAKRVADTLSGL
jgi:broad specificity phosphatase PhoE